jgi:hypothetical protein
MFKDKQPEYIFKFDNKQFIFEFSDKQIFYYLFKEKWHKFVKTDCTLLDKAKISICPIVAIYCKNKEEFEQYQTDYTLFLLKGE